MLPAPKLVFSLGYFPIGNGQYSHILFQIHHQDARTICDFSCHRTPSGWCIKSDRVPSIDYLSDKTIYLAGYLKSYNLGFVFQRWATSNCQEVCHSIVLALGDWAQHQIEPATISEDENELAGPPIFEPGELQKFILP